MISTRASAERTATAPTAPEHLTRYGPAVASALLAVGRESEAREILLRAEREVDLGQDRRDAVGDPVVPVRDLGVRPLIPLGISRIADADQLPRRVEEPAAAAPFDRLSQVASEVYAALGPALKAANARIELIAMTSVAANTASSSMPGARARAARRSGNFSVKCPGLPPSGCLPRTTRFPVV